MEKSNKIYKFFLKLYKPYMYSYIVSFLLVIITTISGVLFSQCVSLLIDSCIDYKGTVPKNNIFSFLLNGKFGEPRSNLLFATIVLLMLVIIAIKNLSRYLRATFLTKVNTLGFGEKLKDLSYRKMQELNEQEISSFSGGEILTIIRNDTNNVKNLVSNIINNIVYEAISIISAAIYLAFLNPVLCIPPLVAMPIIFYTLLKQLHKSRIIGNQKRENIKDLNNMVRENINGIRTVKAFANEEVEYQKFDNLNTTYQNTSLSATKLWSKYWLLSNSIRTIIYICSLFLGAYCIFKGQISTGSYLVFLSYVYQIIDNTTSLTRQIFNSQNYIISMNRLYKFLNYIPTIDDSITNKVAILNNFDIKFENVTLVIDRNTILKNVSFELPYGKKIALMGATGSGKTCIYMLLNRFIDPTEGRITLGNVDIKNLNLDYLRSHFSYVMQFPFLYSNTIINNIGYYADDYIDEEKIVFSSKIAQAHEFIQKLDHGYETIIGEHGLGLSGGQKQRITIARAIYKDAPIFLFDEAFSALDHKTESDLIKELHNNFQSRSWLITTHRANTAKEMDKIIIIDEGMIKEEGNFKQLMAKKGIYYNIYNYQESLKEEGEL